MNDQSNLHPWSGDQPLENLDEDLFHRNEFAASVAREMDAWESRESSLVVGIHGGWGSGKTTLKNFILRHIERIRAERGENPYRIVEFNPWQWSSQSKVIEGFFKEVASAFDSKYFFQKSKAAELAEKWEIYRLITTTAGEAASGMDRASSSSLAALAVVSGVSAVWIPVESLRATLSIFSVFSLTLAWACSAFAPIAESIERVFKGNAEMGDSSLLKARESLSDELAELETPILVVIDDVDRLTISEIREVFQMVKANADFPNLIYLLLCQKDVVVNALDAISGSNGKEFLEKIVQIDLQIPRAPREKIEQILNEEILKIWDDSSATWYDGDSVRWSRIFDMGIAPFFETPRDVKRFLSVYRFYFRTHICDGIFAVNLIDLVLLEVLRVFDFEAYHKISQSLTVRSSSVSRLILGDEEHTNLISTDFEDLYSRVGQSEPEKYRLKRVLEELLPQSKKDYHLNVEKMDFERRLCHENHFPQYFQLTAKQGEVSAQTYRDFRLAIDSSDSAQKLLSGIIERGEFGRLMDRLRAEPQGMLKEQISKILRVLFDISDDLDFDPTDIFYRSPLFDLLWTCQRIVDSLSVQKNRDESVEHAVSYSRGLAGPVFFFAQRLGDERTGSGVSLLSSNCMDQIKEVLVHRIWNLARDGQLWESDYVVRILRYLADWDDNLEVKDWVTKEIESPSIAIIFLKNSLVLNSVSGDGNPNRLEYSVAPNELSKMVDLRRLLESVETVTLEEPVATAIDKLKKALEKERKTKILPDGIPVICKLEDGTWIDHNHGH